MSEQKQVSTDEILAILGAKEVELQMLRRELQRVLAAGSKFSNVEKREAGDEG